MDFVIRLADRNVQEGSGGPFGAAVFERDSGLLVAVGVNVVVASHCSHAHAEMVALALAQQQRGTHDLGSANLPAHELVTSCEPCAMCLGAIPWSGVKRVVCGARDEDARAIGFDEGSKPADWQQALTSRGIEVQTDVLRKAAAAVLQRYAGMEGIRY
jgi:tRNA(Arg) A34 adenosine deaminase TadA